MGKELAAAAVCGAALACATTPPPAASGALGAVRIVDARTARETSATTAPLMLPFGANQNGTALVHDLLERARRQGIATIGELAYVVTFRWHEQVVECRTDVMFEGDPRLAPPPRRAESAAPPLPGPLYTTDIEDFQPTKLSFLARDRELVCKKVQQVAWKKVLVEDERFNAEARRARDRGPRWERVMELEWVDRCGWQELVRPAERFDYELAMGFVPPAWEALSGRFADGKLVAAPPRCYAVAEPLALPPNRLTATAFARGTVPQKAVMPVRGGDTRFNPTISEAAREKMSKAQQ
jgi:hypothetical protein